MKRLIFTSSLIVGLSPSGLSCTQEEQLYTWASVGLPVSSQLWELYGGQTGKEQSFRSTLGPSLATARRTQNSQVGAGET